MSHIGQVGRRRGARRSACATSATTCPTLAPPVSSTSGGVSLVSALQQSDRLPWSSAEPPRKAAAAMIGCPTSQSPKTDKHPQWRAHSACGWRRKQQVRNAWQQDTGPTGGPGERWVLPAGKGWRVLRSFSRVAGHPPTTDGSSSMHGLNQFRQNVKPF